MLKTFLITYQEQKTQHTKIYIYKYIYAKVLKLVIAKIKNKNVCYGLHLRPVDGHALILVEVRENRAELPWAQPHSKVL